MDLLGHNQQQHHQVIVAVQDQKFRSSPTLGDEFVIQGTLTAMDSDNRHVWDLRMTSVDGETMYHSANQVVLAIAQGENWLHHHQDVEEYSSTLAKSDSFVAYRDEFDPSMSSHLPLKSRKQLQRMQR